MTLYMTRAEIISDLPQAFREQNDVRMYDEDLATAWMNYGIHAGTYEWDDVCVDRLYYNEEMGDVDMLSMFRGRQGEDMPRGEFDVWVRENLIQIEDVAGRYSLEDIIEAFGEIEGGYRITNLCGEEIPEFPGRIPQKVWDKITAYDDLFSEIHTKRDINLAATIVRLKLSGTEPIWQIGWDPFDGSMFMAAMGLVVQAYMAIQNPYEAWGDHNKIIIRVE